MNAAIYVVNHPEFGWLSFGGNVKRDGEWIKVQPLDAFRQRLYLAPIGLWLTLDAGTFEALEWNTRSRTVRVGLSRASASTTKALLRIEQPAKVPGVGMYRPVERLSVERDAFMIALNGATMWVELK